MTPDAEPDDQIMTMKHPYTILIADRNPHVRAFLKREMSKEGYRVQMAGNSREVLKQVFGREPLHLLIIDPDLPDADELDILTKMEDRVPALPVIIHAFSADYNEDFPTLETTIFVEKRGTSIERLKNVARGMLQEANAEGKRE